MSVTDLDPVLAAARMLRPRGHECVLDIFLATARLGPTEPAGGHL